MSILSEKLNPILDKLKREWKTFTLAVAGTIAGAWELASQMGADLPSLFNWLPDQYKSAALFAFSLGFLLLRKYSPTTVIVQAPVDTSAPEAPSEPEATVK